MEIRTKIINDIIQRNNYKSYLEIGVDDCINFNNIIINKKISVDPNDFRGTPTFKMTSQEFFGFNKDIFDLIFIDGLHTFEASYYDLTESLKILNENGLVILHDTFPKKYEHQTVPPSDPCWTGDVWKSILKAQLHLNNIEIKTFDVESGITFINKSEFNHKNLYLKEIYKYEYFAENYREILNLTEYKL